MIYETQNSTKNTILSVSYKAFFEKGFHETSIREISKKAGITSGALYRHFTNKEAILSAIIDPHIQYWWKVCNKQLEIFEDNLKKLKDNSISLNELDMGNHNIFIEIVEQQPAIWKFVFHNSKGTQYEYFMDELVDWEYSVTIKMLDIIYTDQAYFKHVSATSMKFIIRTCFEAFFNTFKLDITRKERHYLIKMIDDIYTPFWMALFTKSFNDIQKR